MSTTAAVRNPYWAGNTPVNSDMLPMKLNSNTCPNPDTPSGSKMPLNR